MSKRKISKKLSSDDTIIGYAWYRRDQWQRLREVSSDVYVLEDTYDDWVVNAEESFKDYMNSGMKIEKVDVDIEELVKWSNSEGIKIDGTARAKFVAMKVRQLNES